MYIFRIYFPKSIIKADKPNICYLYLFFSNNLYKLLVNLFENYILCRIHIDSVKVSYQNDHAVYCKLVFRKF